MPHNRIKTQIVVMLAARMTSDIAQAITNIEEHNPAAAHELLVHAQQIVDELSTALDVDTCPPEMNFALSISSSPMNSLKQTFKKAVNMLLTHIESQKKSPQCLLPLHKNRPREPHENH